MLKLYIERSDFWLVLGKNERSILFNRVFCYIYIVTIKFVHMIAFLHFYQ